MAVPASAPAGEYGRPYALADLERMIGVAGSPAVLVGHSLRWVPLLAEAILAPELVAGLVLVAAGLGFAAETSLTPGTSRSRPWRPRPTMSPTAWRRSRCTSTRLVIDRLGEITVPVNVIVGERDKRFLASADVFDKHLEVRQRTVVPGVGHMVHA